MSEATERCSELRIQATERLPGALLVTPKWCWFLKRQGSNQAQGLQERKTGGEMEGRRGRKKGKKGGREGEEGRKGERGWMVWQGVGRDRGRKEEREGGGMWEKMEGKVGWLPREVKYTKTDTPSTVIPGSPSRQALDSVLPRPTHPAHTCPAGKWWLCWIHNAIQRQTPKKKNVRALCLSNQITSNLTKGRFLDTLIKSPTFYVNYV